MTTGRNHVISLLNWYLLLSIFVTGTYSAGFTPSDFANWTNLMNSLR
jgi:hypothetical protein